MTPKEKQKKLITEIMNEDAKDGLYDVKEDDVEKLAEHYSNMMEDVSDKLGKYLVKSVFIDGYNKAKENTYTEEQVRFIICKSFLLGVDRGEYSKELEDKLIQSLKQSK